MDRLSLRTRGSHRTKRRIGVHNLVIGIVLAVSLVCATGRVAVATTYASVITSLTSLQACAGTANGCAAITGVVTAGTPVNMACWQDPASDPGQRYFYVQANTGMEGFVRAQFVASQTRTPACGTIAWINASNWAYRQDGQKDIPPGALNGNPGPHWSGYCWLFAFDSWNLGAHQKPRYSGATAQLTYQLYRQHSLMQPPQSSPPRGSLVFFTYGTTGHVAISMGSGLIETTQGNVGGALPIALITIKDEKKTQLGFVPPSNV